jgi:hypothetical protein
VTTAVSRFALAVAVLVLLGAPVLAQDTTKTAVAGAPASADSSSGGPRESPVELRLTAFTMPSRRTVSTSGTMFDSASPSITGFEFVIREMDGGGLRLAYGTASVSGSGAAGGKLTTLDGRFLIGSRIFNVELGYVLRTTTIAGKDSTLGIARAGVRSDMKLGSSGIIVGWAASYLRQPVAGKDGTSFQGIEGETSVLYALPMVPIYVQLGFRRSALQYTKTASSNVPEELSTVFIGAGFHLGLR